jgi:hypothetical protein
MSTADTVFITDWSNHNSGSLTQDQADGLVAFWHKCTDGNRWFADGFFKSHVDMARSRGIDALGSYHVLWGNQPLDQQADWYVQQALGQAPDVIQWMSDNEPFGYNVAPTIDQVNAFNQMVADRAHVPAHAVNAYCPQWHYGSDVAKLKFPWIQSNYGSNPTGAYASVYHNTVGNQSSRWNGPAPMAYLQYGSRTDVGDANAFRGNLADFMNFIGYTGVVVTHPNEADGYKLLDEGVRYQDGKALGTFTDANGVSQPISTIYNQIFWVRKDVLDQLASQAATLDELKAEHAAMAATLEEIKQLVSAGGGQPVPIPPAGAGYTVSLSGAIRPIPAADGP